VLKAKRKRPKLRACDKLFWVLVRRLWSGWKSSLLLVTPETVVRWHSLGFRLYWANAIQKEWFSWPQEDHP